MKRQLLRMIYKLVERVLTDADLGESDAEAGTERDTGGVPYIVKVQCRGGSVMHQPHIHHTVQLIRELLLQHLSVIRIEQTELCVAAVLAVENAAAGIIGDADQDSVTELDLL